MAQEKGMGMRCSGRRNTAFILQSLNWSQNGLSVVLIAEKMLEIAAAGS